MFLFTRIHAIPRLPKHSSVKCDKEMGRRYSDQARTVQTLTR